MVGRLQEEEKLTTRKHTKLVQESKYIVELDIELIDSKSERRAISVFEDSFESFSHTDSHLEKNELL